MPLNSKNKLYRDTVEITKELFRGGEGTKKGSIDYIIKKIFEGLKEINEEEEYPEFKG